MVLDGALRLGNLVPHQPVAPTKRRFARSMRREPTEAEDRLWHELRGRRLDRIKFRRQVPIGRFVADFVCAEARLIVEIDGSQHADSNYDRERDAELKARGFRVLRFWNDDVLRDLNAVCDIIIAYVRDESLQPWR
jgi:very-short-patch-repair endonuclease